MKTNLIGVSGKIGSGKDEIGLILKFLSSVKDEPLSFEEWKKLELNNSFYLVKKYADKLKDMVCLLIGCTRADLEDQDFKNKELGEEWVKFSVGKGHFTRIYYNSSREALVNLHLARRQEEGDWNYAVEEMTPRKLLQLLGTECGRNIIHPNIWINAMFGDYKPTRMVSSFPPPQTEKEYRQQQGFPNWIITDARFPDEVKAIEDRGGVVIRVNRPNRIVKHSENASYVPNPILDKEHPSETALDSHPFEIVVENNGTIQELVEKIRNLNLV